MPLRTRTGRCVTVLLTAAVTSGVLTGCQSLAAASLTASCEDTESRVRELDSHAVLESRPEGTVVPQGFEKDSGCWADSGDVVLHTDRTYVFPGDEADVLKHYRTAAERDGWKLSGTTEEAPDKDGPAGLCFDLGKGDRAATLGVYFLTEEILDEEGRRPGPEFSSGVGYRVAITSAADGSETSCSD
ncbi:hypothetical protein [Streptomyces sp. NPDC059452]|uniref:hypothetical protein n=1 Tax=Streptomyces sp. NPDC059452 TaxID=3346835 RepID=UPI0036818DD0